MKTVRMDDGDRAVSNEWERMANATINAVMRALHVPARLLGYRYIFYAVHLILFSTPEERLNARRTLYEQVGAAMGASCPMVVRSMHYAVVQAWRAADAEVLRSYTSDRTVSPKDPPGNLEFVFLIAERVRLIVGDPIGEASRTSTDECLKPLFPWLNRCFRG